MKNEELLKQSFAQALGIDESQVVDTLQYNTISEWDSVAHMALVAQIEEAFDIMLDTDDIIELSSFEKAKEILKKYEVAS